MSIRHAMLGVLIAALWGCNFVAARLALEHISPLLLVALRFGIAALPALFIPRPAVGWLRLVALASALFIGQFAFLFWGMKAGMPAGLASVVTQSQAVFTAILAALLLGERSSARTWAGLAVASAGLLIIGTTVGTAGVTPVGLGLTLLAAASWALGNVLLRGLGTVDRFALVVWLSAVPPVPMLLSSLAIDGIDAIPDIAGGEPLITAAAVLYISLAATLGGYGLWSYLLRLYPASTIAPFALMVPPIGLMAAKLVFGEQFGPVRLAGIAVVLAGLLLGAVPLPLGRMLLGRAKAG